jgi:isopentenyl-diphosphate delta-isomerase
MTDLIPAWVDGVLTPVEKLEVHHLGLRHPAVSVFVMDGDCTLLQRRALGKYHTPGLWANTCCTHPRWGENPRDCANRRLSEELGISGVNLLPAGSIEYRADVGGGLTEHEIVDVFLAHAPAQMTLVPNPAEVMQTMWIDRVDLVAEVAKDPGRFTPWLRIYLDAGIVAVANADAY